MNASNEVELEASAVQFYSEHDEAAFFEWLTKIPCVKKQAGRNTTLYISIDAGLVDEDALRELLALFHRYGVEKRQLAKLDRDEFAHWFHNPEAYWHKEVFAS